MDIIYYMMKSDVPVVGRPSDMPPQLPLPAAR
jgi:hypothetical protein